MHIILITIYRHSFLYIFSIYCEYQYYIWTHGRTSRNWTWLVFDDFSIWFVSKMVQSIFIYQLRALLVKKIWVLILKIDVCVHIIITQHKIKTSFVFASWLAVVEWQFSDKTNLEFSKFQISKFQMLSMKPIGNLFPNNFSKICVC